MRLDATLVLTSCALLGVAETRAGQAPIAGKNVKIRHCVETVDLRHGPQLFIDGYLIAESTNLQRVTHPPARFGDSPVLGFKEHVTQPYVTVLRDPDTKRFRMWYNYDGGPEGCIAYAESQDGIHWETPSLGILGPDNRVLKIGVDFQSAYGVSVIDDGRSYPDPARRYKLAWWGQSKPFPEGDPGLRVAFSPDGLHWTPEASNPVLPDFGEKQFLDHPQRAYGIGDIVDVFYDPIRRRYGGLFKTPALPSDGFAPGPRAGAYFRRLVSASFSEDFVKWERPWRVMMPEQRDEGLLEFYSSGGTIARGPLLITFARMLHDDYPAETGGSPDGIGYATMATSRDGIHWERDSDIFFDRNPTPGTWDRAMTWIGSVVPVGDEFYIYYGGYKRGHKVEPRKERQIGLAKMPMDRFVSRSAEGEKPGRLVTVPLRVRAGVGSHFVLNADASAGQIRIQILDFDGKVIPGFSFDDVVPLKEDGLKQPVKWRASESTDLSRLDNQTIHLEFEITNARLFGFDLIRGKELPLRLDNGPHLFIDDRLIDEQHYLTGNVWREAKTNREGRLRTPLLTHKSDAPFSLWLKSKTSADGQVFVRILDEDGKTLPGYKASMLIKSEGSDTRVEWGGSSEIEPGLFRIEFVAYKASLIGFSFKGE